MKNQYNKEISVVIPCRNEARTIKVCIEKVKRCFFRQGYYGEVIVVDNGSHDDSAQIAQESGAKVVRQQTRGYGAALLKGLSAAQGEYIVIGDADDSYDFLDIHRFVDKLKQGYDFVLGTRLKGKIEPGAMPLLHQYIGNPFLTSILNLFHKAGVSDAHCGMRALTREAFEQLELKSSGMEFASEMIIEAVQKNLRITEIPIILSPSYPGRPSHLRPLPDGLRHLRLIVLAAIK